MRDNRPMPGGAAAVSRRDDASSRRAPERPVAARAAAAATLLAATVVALERARAPFDADGLWHVAAGEWILERGAVPRRDPFSWTAHGEPWRLNSYGFDVAVAWLHRLGGRAAVAAVAVVGTVAFAAACQWSARRAGAGPWASAGWASAAAVAASPFVVERPQTASFVCFAAAVACARAALGGSARALAALGALFVCWSNLHLSFTAGVLVVGLAAAGVAVRDRRWVRPAAVAGVAALAGCANPYGLGAYTASLTVRSDSKAAGILEWQPVDPTEPLQLAVLVAAGATAVALARTGRIRRPDVVAPLVVVGAMALDARRNLPLLVVLLVPELALATTAAIRAPRARAARDPRADPRPDPRVVGLLAGLAVLAAVQAGALRDLRPVTSGSAPVRSAAAVPAGCRLLNGYVEGGWIVYARGPGVLVSMDPRNDLYGARRIREQIAVLEARGAWREWIDRHGVDCVVARTDAPLVGALRAAGWPTAARDAQHVLLVRP